VLPAAYPLDTHLRVLFAKNAHSKIFASLVNFSAHADVLPRSNTLLSADWPGATVAAMESAVPGSQALVMAGAVGRTHPNKRNLSKAPFEAVHQYGDRVATLALDSLQSAIEVRGPIAVAQESVTAQGDNPVIRALNLDRPHTRMQRLLSRLPVLWQVLLGRELGFGIAGVPGVDRILRSTQLNRHTSFHGTRSERW
jgi:hypothetical protein